MLLLLWTVVFAGFFNGKWEEGWLENKKPLCSFLKIRFEK